VANVVLVLLVELIVRNLAKRLAPKYERFFNRQPKDLSGLARQPIYVPGSPTTRLEEEAILQPAEMR
jgi:hypothetical protein